MAGQVGREYSENRDKSNPVMILVNLTEFRVTGDTPLGHLWEHFQRGWPEEGRWTLNVGVDRHHPMA